MYLYCELKGKHSSHCEKEKMFISAKLVFLLNICIHILNANTYVDMAFAIWINKRRNLITLSQNAKRNDDSASTACPSIKPYVFVP